MRSFIRSRKPRTGFGGLALVAIVASSVMTPAAAAGPDGDAGAKLRGLRHLAVRHDLLVGSAVDMGALASDPRYGEVLRREFSTVTAENVMKWDSVEPERGVSDFTAADELIEVARRNKQVVHGHVLVWHNQLPGWLTGGSFEAWELETILRDHIFAVAGHFRGRVRSWDVVNEPFNEDGTLRDTIWSQALGPDYIEQALRWAHEADPNAKLYLNDHNLESLGPKSDAMYALVLDLLDRGVPIHGVGFQGHLGIQYGFPGGLTENLQRFADLGLEVAFTEVDVRMPLPVDEAKLATQADYYDRTIRSCLAVEACVFYTVWGFTDAHSWVPGFFQGQGAATPLDEEYRPKPAYFALRDALRS